MILKYKRVLQQDLHAEIISNPFSDPELVANEVNGWVADSTNNMIKELISPSMINDLTRMILCNAIYFKGLWVDAFDSSQEEDFHLNAKETAKVQMMRYYKNKNLMYGENSVARYVLLPYKGNKDINMMIILPQVPYQLRQVEEQIVKAGVTDEWYKSVTSREVNLALPKFRFEEQYDLKTLLCQMGAGEMFEAGVADFSGINGIPDDLFVSHAVHKAVISVDETGTEAAAATAVMMLTRCARIPKVKPVKFHVDQPCVLVIYSVTCVMFVGRLTKPTNQ